MSPILFVVVKKLQGKFGAHITKIFPNYLANVKKCTSYFDKYALKYSLGYHS